MREGEKNRMSSSKADPVISGINERSSITEIMSVLRNCSGRKEFDEVEKLLIAREAWLRNEQDDLRRDLENKLKKAENIFGIVNDEVKRVEIEKSEMAKEIEKKDEQIAKLIQNLKHAELDRLKIENVLKKANTKHRTAEEKRMGKYFDRDKTVATKNKKNEEISTQTKNHRDTELKRPTIGNDLKESERRRRFRIEAEKQKGVKIEKKNDQQKIENVRPRENHAIQKLTEAEKLIRLLYGVLKRQGKTIPELEKGIGMIPDADVPGLMKHICYEIVKHEVEEICLLPSAATAMRSSVKRAVSDDTDQVNSGFEGGKQDEHCGRIDTTQLESEKCKRYKTTMTTVWKSAADMLSEFQNDFKLCIAAVCALYRSKLEQSNNRSMFLENSDSTSLKTLAEYLINKHPSNELSKTVKDLWQEAPNVLSMCKDLATRYCDILFDIYTSRKDHLFRPDS